MRKPLQSPSRARAALAGLERLCPFHQFEDCRVGGRKERDAALRKNRGQRDALLPYLNRWAQATGLALLWLSILSEASAPIWAQALLGVAFSIGAPMTLVQGVIWALLGAGED